jgi:glycosyltransferase involved in cell wall biosynthesis
LDRTTANGQVTVVIPCFNYGRFVGEAVRSALGQNGGAPQVVVVDDGSTDPATVETLDALQPPVRLLRTANGGPAAARNAGAAAADTPHLLFLDADDRLPAGALDALRPPLEADGALGFTYGRTHFFGDLGGELGLPAYDPYRLLHRSLVSATSLLRREAFDAVGGFDPEVPGYEDWDLYLGLLEHGWEGRRVDAVTLEYRRHGLSGFGADRRGYRSRYRALRRKHSRLFARRAELARRSDLNAPGRLLYRTFWAWRPVPAALERAVYAVVFR